MLHNLEVKKLTFAGLWIVTMKEIWYPADQDCHSAVVLKEVVYN